jgi:hypothetical protein
MVCLYCSASKVDVVQHAILPPAVEPVLEQQNGVIIILYSCTVQLSAILCEARLAFDMTVVEVSCSRYWHSGIEASLLLSRSQVLRSLWP